MTSQETPHGRFQRPIQRGQPFHAELAARELAKSQLALAALIALPNDPDRLAVETLVRIGRLRGVIGLDPFAKPAA
jgi:hypothetical protein